MATLITVAVMALIIYFVLFVFFPLGRGAIYDPSGLEETRIMAEMSEIEPGDSAVDLGSGDGRVVIALARKGAQAHGYEVNPVLVAISRRKIRELGLADTAFIHWRSFWNADLSRYDVVTSFQVGFVMGRLEGKLRRELAPGARIVSHYWRFPGLVPEKTRGNVYRYRIPEAPQPGARA